MIMFSSRGDKKYLHYNVKKEYSLREEYLSRSFFIPGTVLNALHMLA